MSDLPNILYTVESAELRESMERDLKRKPKKKNLTIAELLENQEDKKDNKENGSNAGSSGND